MKYGTQKTKMHECVSYRQQSGVIKIINLIRATIYGQWPTMYGLEAILYGIQIKMIFFMKFGTQKTKIYGLWAGMYEL